MIKFFFVSPVFYPDEVSTAGLFTSLCAYMAEDQFEVEVWCAQPSYTHSGRQSRCVSYKGIKIRYLFSTRFHKSKMWGRLLNILTFMLSISCRLLFSKYKTPVFTHTTPPFLGILVSLICCLKGRKLFYIMLDIFPEGMIRLGKLRANNIFVKLWKRLFIKALRRSERIIVLGRDMGDYIAGIYPGGRNKIDYIPHWQDEKLVHPISLEGHPFIREYKLEGKFIVQYSGNMGLWNDMETSGKVVNRNLNGVYFVFIGGGMRLKELHSAISTKEPSNALFLPFQPSEKLGEVLTGCHVSLVSLREGLEGMAVPSKIYGILAAGVPVIALVPEKSEIAYIVREENCGFVINPSDTQGLNNAILELKDNQQLRKTMGLNGRKAFEQKYTTRIIAEKYKSLILSLD